jgi:hypothetical protein
MIFIPYFTIERSFSNVPSTWWAGSLLQWTGAVGLSSPGVARAPKRVYSQNKRQFFCSSAETLNNACRCAQERHIGTVRVKIMNWSRWHAYCGQWNGADVSGGCRKQLCDVAAHFQCNYFSGMKIYIIWWFGDGWRYVSQEEGGRGSTVVKVLCYNSESRWFDPRWCHWNSSLT